MKNICPCKLNATQQWANRKLKLTYQRKVLFRYICQIEVNNCLVLVILNISFGLL